MVCSVKMLLITFLASGLIAECVHWYGSVYCLRQVNGVNGGDPVFVRCVRVCVCVQRTSQSDQFKAVEATDFKFDVHVPRDSPDMTV